jgi:predicted peroxiredoxin
MFLTMDGTIWALQGSADSVKVEGFEPLKEYIDQFKDLGGEILVCAPCSEYYCGVSEEGKTKLLPEYHPSGLSSIVGMITPQTSVVTF